jgi:hypothetical protein
MKKSFEKYKKLKPRKKKLKVTYKYSLKKEMVKKIICPVHGGAVQQDFSHEEL